METKNLESYLAGHAFFSGLEPEYITLITGCAKNVVFKTGEYVFKHGGNAEQFYVLRDGFVAVEIPSPQGGPIVIATLGKDEIVGWSWLLPPHVYQFDARATQKTRALALDGACLRRKCDDDVRLGYELMKRFSRVMTDRLRETRMQLMDVYGNPYKDGNEPG